MRTRAAAILTVAGVLVLTVSAAGQGDPTLPRGAIYLTEPLEVKAGETLLVGPGTSLTGPANVTVWGTLLVNGSAGDPAEFGVQVRVLEGGRADLRQARIWGVNATALEVFGGEVALSNVLIEANTRAAIVKGSGALRGADVVFRDHAGEALYVEGAASVELDRATFSGNGRGITVYSASRFHLERSDLVANGQHLVVDLGPWSVANEDILLRQNTFRAPAPTPAQLPSIVLRSDPPLVEQGEERLVRSDSNVIEDAPVGMRIEGRALVVESTNDSFLDNDVGLSVQGSTILLQAPTLGNDRDIDGSARLTLNDPTYVRDGVVVPTPIEAPRSWLPWAIGAGLLVLLAVGIGLALRTRSAPPAPPREPEPAPPPASPLPPPSPEPDLGQPITPVERRILEDILEHPGTSQREVADRLGYTRQALHYHVKKLEARRLVVKTVEGRETRCEVPAAVASLVAPGTRTGSHEKA